MDYIENISICCHNAVQSSVYFSSAFGFKILSNQKSQNLHEVILKKNLACVRLFTPINRESILSERLNMTGDFIHKVTLRITEFSLLSDLIKFHVDLLEKLPIVHKVDIGNDVTIFLKNNLIIKFKMIKDEITSSKGQSHFDHIALCVNKNQLQYWVEMFIAIGFCSNFSHDFSGEKSGMNSIVFSPNSSGNIKLVLVEPRIGDKESQLQTFLQYNHGHGVQHIALSTNDIIASAISAKHAGVDFIEIPSEYYDALDSFHCDNIDVELLKTHNIVLDSQGKNHLLQCFSKPITPFPTIFIELVQRKGMQLFGKDNIERLFKAMESSQVESKDENTIS